MDSSQFDVAQLQSLIVKMVKYLLNSTINKYSIKKVDLIEKCCDSKNKLFPRIFSGAQTHLNEIYGIHVIEIENIKPPRYICISKFPANETDYVTEQRRHLTLLFIILSYIYMKGGAVSEHAVVDFLKRFGIEMNDAHSHFGNVKKLINQIFIKQLYLVIRKQTQEGSNEERITFEWGTRADLEFPKKGILDVIAKLYNKPIICFKKQYSELYGDEMPPPPQPQQEGNAE